MNNILTVGADLGNDAIKIIGPAKRELFITNIISPWHERRVVQDDLRYPLNLLEVEVTSKGNYLGKFFVGNMAYKFNRGIIKERTVVDRHTGKTNDTESLLILLTSIGLSLLKPDSRTIKEKIVLGTMLPSEEFFKDHKQNVFTLEDRLTGTHQVKFLHPAYNRIEVEFDIVGVNVQPEGWCALNAVLYSDDGTLLDRYKTEYAERTILGLDVGSLTTDVTVVNNFELRTFFGIDKGTIDPLNRITDHIKTEHMVSLPRHKVDRAVVNNEKLLIYGEEIPNFREICQEFILYEGRQLIEEFTSKAAAAGIQLPDIGLLVLCGGGSLLFKDIIKQHLSRIPMIFSDNAIMLNALGAWKNANNLKNQLRGGGELEIAAGR